MRGEAVASHALLRTRRRMALGLSIGKMAAEIGCPKSSYANWEKEGGSSPSAATRFRIESVFQRLEGKTTFLMIGLPSDKAKILSDRAAKEGKTPEEVAAEIFGKILGLFLAGALLLMGGAAHELTSAHASDETHWLFAAHRGDRR